MTKVWFIVLFPGNKILDGVMSKSTPCVAVVFPPKVKVTVASSVAGREISNSKGMSMKSQFSPSFIVPPSGFTKLMVG